MRTLRAVLVLAVAASFLALASTAGAAAKTRTYLVLYEKGVSTKAGHNAIKRAGGRVTRENRKIGLAYVRTRSARFKVRAANEAQIAGVAANKRIGTARPDRFRIERERGNVGRDDARHGAGGGDPFGPLQWDMQVLGATPQGSYRTEQASHAVRVGIIDTGVDGGHPDIAPNFDGRLSRNFTTDDPVIDGPCADDIDGSCAADPANVDENGHGTHVAGTIAGALNGLGMAGVAPKADIVNLRAGQDSGYFFLLPTVDALTYAGDHGVDVVNMSYYVDPWLFNCTSNPADSPAEQREQQVIIGATTRALRYARQRDVTLIAAEGNENTDLGKPTSDPTSPDYPDAENSPHERTIDNGCVSMPSEGPGVVNVSSVGPTLRKAYYSNYGVEQTDVSAPGGDRREFYGTPKYNAPENRILAPYPLNVARSEGTLDADGNPNTPLVLKDCKGTRCALYQYLQGTSMAAPHAVGVAALVIARNGKRDSAHGGVKLSPATTERLLERTATKHACPAQNPFTYPDPDLGPEFTALCEGTTAFNGFYGHGIVNASAAAGG